MSLNKQRNCIPVQFSTYCSSQTIENAVEIPWPPNKENRQKLNNKYDNNIKKIITQTKKLRHKKLNNGLRVTKVVITYLKKDMQ